MQAQLVHELHQLVGCVQLVVLDTKRIADPTRGVGAFPEEPGGSPVRVPGWALTSMPATRQWTDGQMSAPHLSPDGRTSSATLPRKQLSTTLEQDQAILR